MITFDDILSARERLRPFLSPTPFRRYGELDAAVGAEVWVKHENFQPTGSFKVRNALSALARLDGDRRRRGVVAATRGNHGLGLAHAGALLGVSVVLCVPEGNNPEKNAAMRALGATVVEKGRDYDEAVAVAAELSSREGRHVVHSTNDRDVLAGAGTLALEMLESRPELEAMVVAVGGGSQALGAVVTARKLQPGLAVYGVQAAGASAFHDSWHRRERVETAEARTFADGLATRKAYDMTFPGLLEGLAGCVTATDREIADTVRLVLRTTHTLVEGAGAAGLAGLMRLKETLRGRRVGVILSGANIDQDTLRRVMNREI